MVMKYLKRIAEMLKQEAGENSILCRQGGDEFTLFYYKYGKEALVQKIEALKALQSGQKVRLRDGLTVDLRFSMGSSMAYGAVDYDKMYREADEKMYEDKKNAEKAGRRDKYNRILGKFRKMKELSHHGNPETMMG